MKKKIKKRTPARSIKHTHTHHPLHKGIFGVLSLLIVGLTFALLAYTPTHNKQEVKNALPNSTEQVLGPKKGTRWIDTQADRDGLRSKPIVLRDAYSTHFKNDDGTVTALFTSFKQNYEVAPGIWEPIDYSLEKSKDPRYDYQTKNGVGIYLSRNGTVARKENDLFLEAGAPTLGLYNPNTQSFVRLNNLDNAKVTKDSENNSLVLDGTDVKLIVYAYDLGAREDLILENNTIVQNASDDDLLTLKAPLTSTGKLLLNNHELSSINYELTSKDTLVLVDNKSVTFPFPEGHDAKDNPAKIRRFLIKEGDTWYLYTSVPVSWLKKLSTSYPVTVDPDYAGDVGDRIAYGFSTNYTTARGTGALHTVTATNYVGQLKISTSYYIYRSFVKFVTSGIPDTAQINQVNMNLTAINDYSSTTEFDVNIVPYNWSARDPLTTSGNIDPAYDGCLAETTSVLWRNTSGMSTNTVYTSSNLATDWIGVTAGSPNTYYCLQSNLEDAGTVPTANNGYIYLASANYSTPGYRPVLTIIYQPAQVTASVATNVSDTSFSANWNTQSGSGADGYTLDVATDSGFTSFVATGCGGGSCNAKAVGNVVTYSVTGLTASTNYYYRVRATDSVGGGTGANSSTITVTTSAPPPSAPTANAASNVTSTSLSANWSSSAGATNYKLSVSTVATCDGSYVTACGGSSCNLFVTGDVTTYAVTPLSANTTYYYCLKATNAAGDSALSNITTQLSKPGAPTANAATSITTTSFTANWSAPAGGVASYKLDVATDSGFTSFVTNGCNSGASSCNNYDTSTSTSHGISNLTCGVTYYYRVRGANATGSSSDSGTVITTNVPCAPTANAASSITTTGFTANWSTSTGASSYRLDVSADSFSTYLSNGCNSGASSCNDYNTSTSTSHAITNLTCGVNYYYRVRAVNGSGTSSSSSTINPITIPCAPTANAVTVLNNGNFIASWSTPAGATSYRIDVANNSGFTDYTGAVATACGGASCNNATVNSPYTLVSGLAGSTSYYYRVRAVNANGTSSSSSIITAITKPITVTVSSIAIDSTSYGSGSNVSSISWSHTVTGNDTLLVVGISKRGYGGTAAVSSVKFDGVDLSNSINGTTAAAQTGSGDYSRIELWWAKDSSLTGHKGTAHNIVVSLSGGTDWMQAGAVSFTGVDQSTPLGTFASATNGTAGTSAAVPVTSTPEDIVIDVLSFWNNSQDATKGYNQTLRWYASSDGAWKGGGSTAPGANPGSNTVIMSWAIPTSGSQAWALGGVSVKHKVTNDSFSYGTNSNSFTAYWNTVASATSYILDVSRNAAFTQYVSNWQYQNVGNTNSAIVNNLIPSTTYYYRVRSVYTSGGTTYVSPPSGTTTITTTAGNSPVCASNDNQNTTISYSCSFPSSIDGIGNSDLTLAAGATLTVSPSATLVWTPGKKIDVSATGAYIVLGSGASLKQGYITYPDLDLDGYPDSLTPSFATASPSAGGTTRARFHFTDGHSLDCDSSLSGGNTDCDTVKRVFITSTKYDGNLKANTSAPLTAIDDKCRDAANNAGLGGQWMAWISDGTGYPGARLSQFGYKYVLVDETTAISNSWNNLMGGSLLNKINKTEFGVAPSGTYPLLPWTGTSYTGGSTSINCSGWNSNSAGVNGTIGNTDAQDNTWTNYSTTTPCNQQHPLVCFEQ